MCDNTETNDRNVPLEKESQFKQWIGPSCIHACSNTLYGLHYFFAIPWKHRHHSLCSSGLFLRNLRQTFSCRIRTLSGVDLECVDMSESGPCLPLRWSLVAVWEWQRCRRDQSPRQPVALPGSQSMCSTHKPASDNQNINCVVIKNSATFIHTIDKTTFCYSTSFRLISCNYNRTFFIIPDFLFEKVV